MIRVKYECDETGQKMDITIALKETDEEAEENGQKAEIFIDFTPTLTEESQDPFGIMMKVFKAVTKA